MKVTQEPDTINDRIVLWVAAATVSVTVLGVLIAWGLLEWNVSQLPDQAQPVSARTKDTRAEVNAIEFTLFDREFEPPQKFEEPKRLDEYGFVDRKSGVVHIPIRRAMQLYLEQQKQQTPRSANDPPKPEPEKDQK